jgi:hypothetical protein
LTDVEADKLLDSIKLYNEVSENIILKDFIELKALSRLFVAVATYDEPEKVKDDEFIAVIEGIVYPFFGFAYSIDKVQYNVDDKLSEKIDH